MSVSAPFRRGLLLVVLAALLWGTTGLTSKVLYRVSTIDPLSVGFLRLATAAPALLVMGQALAPRRLLPTARQQWRPLLALGSSMAAYNATFFAAIERTSVTAATLIAICTAPLFVAVLARAVLHEPLTRPTRLALAAGLTGTLLLMGAEGGRDLLRTDYAWGNGLALGAGLSYASYALVARAAGKAEGAHPAALAALSFAGAALLLAPAAASGLQVPRSWPGWVAVLYLGLVPTALAYLLYFSGLRHVPVTTASIGTLAEPLTAAILAAVFLHERLTGYGLIGAGLLLSSLAILSVGRGEERSPISRRW